MRVVIAAILAIALAGCATTPVPAMRPLTEAHIETMGPTPVVVTENNNGIEKSWFYTSTASAGAAYGLIGALVSAAMDAIINAGPSRRAQKAANEMAELVTVDQLNASLTEQFRQQVPGATPPVVVTEVAAVVDEQAVTEGGDGAAVTTEVAAIVTEPAPVVAAAPAPEVTGVSYAGVSSRQRLTAPDALDDAVDVTVSYTLSEDSSTLRIIAVASYQNPLTPYATPYTFSGSPPRTEREGPAYRNSFTYYSSQMPVPSLTPELRERLVASIQDSARDENGVLPVEGTDGFQSMTRELEKARDDELTKDEIAIFLTREWLRDDGALLRREIEQAHAFIARYVLLDINRTAVPSLTGSDELLETMAGERTVRRIGAGVSAGSYVSSSANVSSFSTYGNVVSIAAINNERIDQIRDAHRAARR